jgi:ribose/xylose/arabinose/galactoside ABC-type transport system permease subunit
MGMLVGALTILGVDAYWNALVIRAILLPAELIDAFDRYLRKV